MLLHALLFAKTLLLIVFSLSFLLEILLRSFKFIILPALLETSTSSAASVNPLVLHDFLFAAFAHCVSIHLWKRQKFGEGW